MIINYPPGRIQLTLIFLPFKYLEKYLFKWIIPDLIAEYSTGVVNSVDL